jgi:hypothetical protein
MRDVERTLYGANGDAHAGVFAFHSPKDLKPLRVIASSGEGWDHVSVSRAERTPTWEEMEFIKRKFFADHETAMQLHVPPGEHVNCHPHCLHLWRPHDVEIPRPPAIMVGPST